MTDRQDISFSQIKAVRGLISAVWGWQVRQQLAGRTDRQAASLTGRSDRKSDKRSQRKIEKKGFQEV